jgi:cobalt-zinc-cadmium efflux system protein
MGAGHDHGHSAAPARALWIALGLNAAYLVAEVIGGLAFGSLALLADAAHMTSDVAGLVVALVAVRLAQRPASATHTWGWQRAEVLGALANAATLIPVTGWVIFEAVGRFRHPQVIEGGPVLAIAIGGLFINAASAVVLARAAGNNLNMRGAFLHMAADAAGSVAVIIAAIAVLVADLAWVDPVASLVIAALVIWSTWGLLRDTVHILLEASPTGIDPDQVTRLLTGDPDVDAVHHVHLWAVGSEQMALSAHVVISGEPTLHEAQAVGDRLRHTLAHEFAIIHATLELECHPCATPDHDPPSAAEDHAHAH